MRTAFPRSLLPCAALMLAACGDGSVRSPDLPPAKLVGIGQVACTYPNGGTSIAVGQTANCQVVGGCTFEQVTAEGDVDTITGACPDLTFRSNQPAIGAVDPDTGIVTGVSAGQTQITAGADGVTSPPATVTVNAACGESIVVTPVTATVVSGATTDTSQLYTATITLNNGSTTVVSTSPDTSWSSSDQSAARFTANRVTAEPNVAAQTTVTVTATYTGDVCDGQTSLTDTAELTVRPVQLIASNALCVETTPPAQTFTGCRADSGACLTPDEAILLDVGDSQQLQVRARFDIGEECNVTNDADIATANEATATVDDNALLTGVAAGNTTVSATFGGQTAGRPVQVAAVVPNQVLGKNSLAVFSKQPFGETEGITVRQAQNNKFACIGANNLIIDGLGGRTPRGSLKAFALAATCSEDALDEEGNCTAPDDQGAPSAAAFETQVLTHLNNGVTNLPPHSTAPGADLLDDGIVWNSVAGYWNGSAGCETETSSPSGNVGDLHIDPRSLVLGDDGFPVEPSDSSLPQGAMQPNGLVYSDAAVRIGFNCVTATYANPEDPDQTVTDGMTVLVLPVTNDLLLGGSNDGYQLCDTLEPLFGTGPLLGLVETTKVLSAITSGLSPLLEQLDAVPIDSLITRLQAGLSLLTAPLIDLLAPTLIDPVLEPLVCEVTTAVNLLLGLLTGTTPDQACEETPTDPAP